MSVLVLTEITSVKMLTVNFFKGMGFYDMDLYEVVSILRPSNKLGKLDCMRQLIGKISYIVKPMERRDLHCLDRDLSRFNFNFYFKEIEKFLFQRNGKQDNVIFR